MGVTAAPRRTPQVGGWPNFWLAAVELVSRAPEVDAYLLAQDDAIFCAGTFEYVSRFPIPADCGVLSLFCPACHNRELGWFGTPVGYGMTSALALLFPRERMFEFLAHPWTVNHRRAAPKSEHFRGDGLHHIDGVVGEWCRLAKYNGERRGVSPTCSPPGEQPTPSVGLQCYCHSPSLAQHIGHDSVMYPGFEGKRRRRYADSFPGEHVDANEVYVGFHRSLSQWTAGGGSEAWSIPAALWASLRGDLRPGSRTLETGSGLSTKLFLDAGCDHTALEHDAAWADRLRQTFPACAAALQLRPLTGEPPWYDWAPDRPFDAILIDGPPGAVGRQGIARVIELLVHDDTVIYLDDCAAPGEAALCDDLGRRLGWPVQRSTAGHHGYARLARRPLPTARPLRYDPTSRLDRPSPNFVKGVHAVDRPVRNAPVWCTRSASAQNHSRSEWTTLPRNQFLANVKTR